MDNERRFNVIRIRYISGVSARSSIGRGIFHAFGEQQIQIRQINIGRVILYTSNEYFVDLYTLNNLLLELLGFAPESICAESIHNLSNNVYQSLVNSNVVRISSKPNSKPKDIVNKILTTLNDHISDEFIREFMDSNPKLFYDAPAMVVFPNDLLEKYLTEHAKKIITFETDSSMKTTNGIVNKVIKVEPEDFRDQDYIILDEDDQVKNIENAIRSVNL